MPEPIEVISTNKNFQISFDYSDFINKSQLFEINYNIKLKQWLMRSGEFVKIKAQSNLYPGHGYVTGNLHDSIHTRYGDDLLTGIPFAQIRTREDVKYAAIIEGYWQEMWGMRWQIWTGQRKQRKTDPFMRPALEESKPFIMADLIATARV